MDHVLQTLACAVPGAAWLLWAWRKDRNEPEPARPLLVCCGLGCAAAGMTLLLRPLVEQAVLEGRGSWTGVLDAFLVTALPEEAFKGLAFLAAACFLRDLDEPMDGLLYGVAVGLGFATVENVLFLNLTGEWSVLIMRGFTAMVVHACLTGCLGLVLVLHRFRAPAGKAWLSLLGVLAVIALHGLYDLFLFVHPELMTVALLGVLPAIAAVFGLAVRWCQRVSPRYHRGTRGQLQDASAAGFRDRMA